MEIPGRSMASLPKPSLPSGVAPTGPAWGQAVAATWRQAIIPHAVISIVIIPAVVYAMAVTVPGMTWWGDWGGGPLGMGWLMFATGMFMCEFALGIPCPDPRRYWPFEAVLRFVPLFFLLVASALVQYVGPGLYGADNLPRAWWIAAELMRGLAMGQFAKGHKWRPWEWKRLRFVA
ncbi:hypothetical protein IIA16_05090 [bacterium]|nr:hypothetical protein [bacterium]